jgi:pSer/pThr/pTyr-binding forkhead associated (FHA) protein
MVLIMPRELLIQCPDGQMKTIPLTGERLSVGRSSAAELCFPEDAGLSRQHFAFESEGGEWTVEDLGSKNGTFVGKERVAEPRALRNGDQIRVGGVLIVFRLPRSLQSTLTLEDQ